MFIAAAVVAVVDVPCFVITESCNVLYPRNIVCFSYIIVNTQYTGDKYNNNNNNNNNLIC